MTGATKQQLVANFVAAGNEYKELAKSIRHEDGDRAWMCLDELKRKWVDTAWLLHEHLSNDGTELQRAGGKRGGTP